MTLIGDVSKDMSRIVDILDKANGELLAAEPVFDLNGRKLEEICRTHPHYLANYEQRRMDLKSLGDLVQAKRDALESRLWRKYLEGYQRALTSRDIQAYILGEPEYVQLTELLLEVTHLRDQFASVVKALEAMSWMLSHVTKLRVAEMQDAIL